MSDAMSQGRTTSFRDVLYVLFRQKWKIVIFMGVVTAVVGYSALSTPDVYESNAKLMLTQPPNSTSTNANLDPTVAEIQLLESRGLAEAVVDRVGPRTIMEDSAAPAGKSVVAEAVGRLLASLGLRPSKPGTQTVDPTIVREAAVMKLMSSLTVGSEPKSNVVSISYQARSPKEAQRILGEVVTVYGEKHLQIHSMSVSVQLLADQTDRLRAKLERARLALSGFRNRMNVAKFDEQQTLHLQRIEGLRSQIQTAEAEYSATEAAVATTENKLGLRQVEQEQRVGLEALGAKLGVLRRQLQEGESELSNMTRAQRELETVEEEVQSADAEYRTYQSSLEKARIARVLESEQIAKVGILESPTYLMNPKGGGMRMVLLGAIVAAVGGIGIAFLFERMNHSVRTPKDIVENLKLDYIASIPPVRAGLVRSRLRREVRRRRSLPDPLEVVPLELAEHVVTWMYFIESMRECFEELRNRVESITTGSGKRPYALAITSCYRGEGVTSVAAALSYSVAYVEAERVLLLNMNGHHPERDIVPRSLRPSGLIEIEPERRLIDPPTMNPKQFGTDGANGGHPTAAAVAAHDSIVPSTGMPDCKYVVMDLPSLREGGSAFLSAAAADGTLLVVESERVRREVVETAIERLEQAGARVLGVVLNKRRLYIPPWLYRLS